MDHFVPSALRRSALSAVLLCAAFPVAAQVQVQVVPAPIELLQGFHVADAQVQDLLVPQHGGAFRVNVVLGGRQYTLDLEPHDVRAPGFQLLVDDGHSLQQAPTPPSVTYRGTVAGRPDSAVGGTVIAGQLRLVIDLGGEVWGVQPARDVMPELPASAHVVYNGEDGTDRGNLCGTVSAFVPPARDAGESPIDVLKEAEIAIDCDIQFYQANGSNVTNTQNDALAVIAGVNTIFKRDVTIQYLVTTLIVRTVPIASYEAANSAVELLNAFSQHWNLNHGGVSRDVAHLMTGQNEFGSTIGIANAGTVCDVAMAYSVVWRYTANLTNRRGLSSHELGHNFGASHCDGVIPCWIMCSVIGGCSGNVTKFGPTEIAQIVAFKNSRNCLDTIALNAPTLSSITPGSAPSYSALPQNITLTGTELDSVHTLTIGSTPVLIQSQDPTTLTFTVPNGFEIASHQVTVTNSVGTSNPLSFDVQGLHPSVLVAPSFTQIGVNVDYTVHTDRNWIAVYFISASGQPSVLPGIVSFQLGNGFTSFFQLATILADTGGTANINFALPLGFPGFITLYYQAITWDGVSLVAPLETSNAQGVLYL